MDFFHVSLQYGGNPVSMAIANAVLNVIEDERLQQHALNVGTYLIQALRKVQRRRSLIGDVRGIGLFVGIELVKDPQTKEPGAEEALYISRRFKEVRKPSINCLGKISFHIFQ